MAKQDTKKKKADKTDADGRLIVATNRRARFDYEIVDTWEAGIALTGPEVKSLREARVNLGDAFELIRRIPGAARRHDKVTGVKDRPAPGRQLDAFVLTDRRYPAKNQK